MALNITCPKCAAAFGLGEDMRGAKMFCPKCGTSLVVSNVGVVKANARPAPGHARMGPGINPLWLLVVVLLSLLAFGVTVYVLSPGHADNQQEVAKNDSDPLPLPQPHEQPADKPHGQTKMELTKNHADEPHGQPKKETAEPEPKLIPSIKVPAHEPDGDPKKETENPADKSPEKPLEPRPRPPISAAEKLAHLIKNNEVLPGKAVPGKAFTHQLPMVKGAQVELVPSKLIGPTLTPDGLLTWTPPPGTRPTTYDVKLHIRPGSVIRTVKIIVQEDLENAVALPSFGGWVMLSDTVTLIVSLPDQAKLVFIDTAASKELKRVALTFKPDRLAVQGKHLFASEQGASVVHVLDLDSGADKKAIKVPDGAVTQLVCHPKNGHLYGLASKMSSTGGTIVVLNPETGAGTLTGDLATIQSDNTLNGRTLSRGAASFLAIDPNNANTLYCPVVTAHGRWDNRSNGMGLAKYALKNKIEFNRSTAHFNDALLPVGPFWPLERIAAIKDVTEGGFSCQVDVSGDSKRVGIVGKSSIVVLMAKDIKTQAGAATCSGASNLAFHPVLDLVAVAGDNLVNGIDRGGTSLHLFNSESLIKITQFTYPFRLANSRAKTAAGPNCRLLTFGDRGTKLLYYDWMAGYLRSTPLTLTDKDKVALAKAYPIPK